MSKALRSRRRGMREGCSRRGSWVSWLIYAFGLIGILIGIRQAAATAGTPSVFVKRYGRQLALDGRSYYSSQANNYYLWYKPQPMVDEILDHTRAMGLNTLRVFMFCEGHVFPPDGSCFQMQGPGDWHEPTFQKFDYAVRAAGVRSIKLIVPLVNQWDDGFGGMRQYVNWARDAGAIPPAILNDIAAQESALWWGAADDPTREWLRWVNVNSLEVDGPKYLLYQRYHDLFYTLEVTRQWYRAFVAKVINRTNTLAGGPSLYQDDPAILMWELANEPRAESDKLIVQGQTGPDLAYRPGERMQAWIQEMAVYIKSLDPNHLVSTGQEGWYADSVRANAAPVSRQWWYTGQQGTSYLDNHRVSAIDACSFHMYPEAWGMSDQDVQDWIREHVEMCHTLVGKPVYLGEYGWAVGREEVLHTFIAGTENWRRAWNVGFVADPVRVASPSIDGNGAIRYLTDNATFAPTTGDGGGSVLYDPPKNAAGYGWLIGHVYLESSAPSNLKADLFAKSGAGYTWTDGDDVPLVPGQWTRVVLRVNWLADSSMVRELGMRVITPQPLPNGTPPVAVYFDRILVMPGNNPAPTSEQMALRASKYAAWGQQDLDTRLDGQGFWFLNGRQGGAIHRDLGGFDVVSNEPVDQPVVASLQNLAAQFASRTGQPLPIAPRVWEACEPSGRSIVPATSYSDAISADYDSLHATQGQTACRLAYQAPAQQKAYWEFSNLQEDWSREQTLSARVYAEQDGVRATVVVSTGAGYDWHESSQITLQKGWNVLNLDLRASTWRTAASNWQPTVPIANRDQVKRVSLGLFGYQQAGAVWLDAIELTAAEGLVLYYSFNTNQGGRVTDQSGFGYHATVFGPRYVTGGIKGGAYEFDGKDDHILTDRSLGYVGTGTIAFWMKPSTVQDWRNPFSTDYASWDDCIRFEESSSGALTMGALGLGTIFPFPNGVYEETYTKTLKANRWYHVVYAWDTARDYGYLNGQLVFTTPHPDDNAAVHPNIPNTAGYWRQLSLTFNRVAVGNGYSTETNRYWKGLVDEVRIYTRVLTAKEVQQLYTNP